MNQDTQSASSSSNGLVYFGLFVTFGVAGILLGMVPLLGPILFGWVMTMFISNQPQTLRKTKGLAVVSLVGAIIGQFASASLVMDAKFGGGQVLLFLLVFGGTWLVHWWNNPSLK